MNIRKSILTPSVWEGSVKLLDPDRLQIRDLEEREKGCNFSIVRIDNKMMEPITVINEFGETTVIQGIDSRIERKVSLIFNKPKMHIENANNKLFQIEITEDELSHHKALYIPEQNVVLSTLSMYQYYDIRHPYSIRNYEMVVEMAVNKLINTVGPLSLMWWVNEPTETNKTYYMNLGDEIVIVPKTNFPNTEVTFDLIKPKGNITKQGTYETQTRSLKDFQEGSVKELKYNIGKFGFSIMISTSESLLRLELDKQKKNLKNLIVKTDHEALITMIEQKHQKELKELHEDNTKKLSTLLDDMQEKIKILEQERNNYKQQLEAALNTSKIMSQYHTHESASRQADAKVEISKHSIRKEQISIWSDVMKYGLGGLITLVTILVAQKSSK